MEKTFRYTGKVAFERGPNGSGSIGYYPVVRQNLRSGSSNPNWRSALQKRQFVASNYTRDSVEGVFQPGSFGLKWNRMNNGQLESCSTVMNGDAVLLNGLGIPSSPFSASDRSKALATANSRLLDKVRDQTTEVQGFTVLGELRETLRMFRRPLQGSVRIMDNYARAMKRRAVDSRTKRQFLNGLTDQYLEMVFGWQPVISDTFAIARTAARAALNQPPLERLIASSEADQYSAHTNANVGGFDCRMRHHSLTRGELTVQSMAYLRWQINGPSTALERFIQLSGFNLENFVPSVYDLIPFSFVADYFSNLGDIVSAATTCQAAVIGSIQSIKETNRRVETCSFDFPATVAGVGGFGHSPLGTTASRVEYKHVNLSRLVGGPASIPIPTFHLDLPGARQFTNLGALVLGFFSGISPPRR